MSDRESTAVGYRLRIQPADLSTYPDKAKLRWFELVVKYGLEAKRRDLRRGKDKDGNIHPLRPRTIKYRRSEVGPVTKTAPRGIPALDLSRVMSLLTARAHTSSAEFYWDFDSHTGRSFAEILHFWADDQGHDVFGLSQAGRDWTMAKASAEWDRWLALPATAAMLARPGIPGAKLIRKAAVRQPIRKVEVRRNIDLSEYDLSGDQSQLEKAIEAGEFSGFRRLNARGEQWKPGQGIPAGNLPPKSQIAAMKPVVAQKPSARPSARPAPGKVNLPVTQFIPSGQAVPVLNRDQVNELVVIAPKTAISPVPVGLLRVQADKIGPLQDLVNQRISEYYRDNPAQAPIVVLEENGKFFIHEGHHRATGAVMRQSFNIPGLIFRRKPGTKNDVELVIMDDSGNLWPFRAG